jgi:nitrate reductase NapE component
MREYIISRLEDMFMYVLLLIAISCFVIQAYGFIITLYTLLFVLSGG